VITHAGNNTTTECFHYGKPMIALPLFWDQYDNAQRVHETGHGVRLATYAFEEEELLGAVESLLADTSLHQRMHAVSHRVQAHSGRVRAASLVEQLAETGQPVTR
jgi:UDP:flavonoid glycosyltransferase YjiC (YdhE family)